MKSANLTELNFRHLVRYSGGAPLPEYNYPQPLDCEGFCVSCEQKGLLIGSGERLYVLSHGADTADFESLFGIELPLENDQKYIKAPVMFVLESPGGMNGNGIPHTCQGVEKEAPVCHYYWMPPKKPVWPSKEDALASANRYGPYFAYVLRRFRLKNAYFTNVIKCGLRFPSGRFISYSPTAAFDIRIRDNCCREFLEKEVRAFQPAVVFAFGDRAYNLFHTSAVGKTAPLYPSLYHPATPRLRRRILEDNDERIQKALISSGLLAEVT